MTNLLIRLFIKDYKNIKDQKVRKRYGEFGSFIGIFTNILLFIIKIFIGIFINSIAIIADSFNNLTDSLSSIITLFGFKIADRPADKEHPFGHGRAEYIAGLIVSFIIILIGFELFKTSFLKVFKKDIVNFSYLSICILFLTVLIKIWQSLFNKKIGKLINSHSLIATAIDSRNDVLITSSTILSLFIFRFFNFNIDGYFGIAISIFLIYSGFNLAKATLSPLLGESIDLETFNAIEKIAFSFKEVLGVHDILIHNYGPNKNIASIHVEVSDDIPINKAHYIIHNIENKVKETLNILLTIHMDPISLYDFRIEKLVSNIHHIFKYYKEKLEIHDCRIFHEGDKHNFVFDLVIPYEFSIEKQEKLIFQIKQMVYNFDNSIECIINIEQNFINNN